MNELQKTRNTFYYLGIFLYVLSLNIQYSYMFNDWSVSDSPMLLVLKLLKYGAYLFCIIHFFTVIKFSHNVLFAFGIMLVFSVYAMYTGPQKAPLFYFVLIATAVKTDFKKIVKIFLAIQVTTFVLYLMLSLAGVMGSGVVEEVGRTRSFLGYGWVNRASYNLFFISLELLYLRKRALDPVLSIILALVNYFVYVKTHTVFSMLLTFMVIFYGTLYYFYSRSDRKITFVKKNTKRDYYLALSIFLAFIVFGIALILVFKSSNPFLYRLNRFVSGRLELGKKAIEQYGLHLGGNKLQWVGSSTLLFGLAEANEYFYVDNGFLQLALEFGLLFAGFAVFLYTAAIKKSIYLKDYDFAIIALMLGFVFVFEPYVIDFAFNPFVLYYFSHITRHAHNPRLVIDRSDIKFLVSDKG